MLDFKNKTVFITGASSGIGAACAKAFAEIGANLLLCARQKERVAELARECAETYHIKTHVMSLDVRDLIAVNNAMANLPAAFQSIDVLVNNAGLAAGLATVQEGDVRDWDAMIDTNVKGLLYVTRAVLPAMIARAAGHIINIGSIAGHTVYPKGAVYCASKQAVHAITEGLRMDLYGTPIRVTSVDPGAVATNFSTVRFKGDTEKAAKVYEGFTPLSAKDVAEIVVFAATRPLHVNIVDVLVTPTAQAAATMIHRET
jgi:3-hydroxy acid dehydrogenase/malonic semialdehyde reductase